MQQELQTSQHRMWRSEAGSRLWLSMLIAAMEAAAQPETRGRPVPPGTAAQLRAQLALPASSRFCRTSDSRVRH
ncbi:transcriptional regulator [Bradyrhizobium sp.]|uniref:transcriptional regulator n=1 Tax=Bradyrhizobium sp. TaxID=376 RepID=UPI00239B5A92|nr:transcriptional regulator [Bradyrhizobium sp.]MDE2376293.1 transcriptional regulator [Bradyrhizobium sp.]